MARADLPAATRRSPAPDLGPRAERMIARITEAARTVFLSRGYAGATIDEITRTAGVSRASFYTYFPTKRDVLLSLGADSASAGERIVREFAAGAVTEERARAFVDAWFDHLDSHGAFATAWTQAAQEDDEIRRAGTRRHLRLCKELGSALGGDASRGLAAYSLIERAWSLAALFDRSVDDDGFRREVARFLALASSS